MLWIDRIHRWTGAFIGVLLALLGLTGTLLLYEDAYLRATVPHAADALVVDNAQVASIAHGLMVAQRPTSLTFPSEDLALYKLTFTGGRGAYADQSGEIVQQWASKWDRPELWLFDFHHHLLMGDTGTTLAGFLALIGLGFVVTGFLLWWRTRKTFAFRLWPAKFSRLHIVRHHRDLGVVMSPLLLAQFLTGAMLTLRPVAEFVLAPLRSQGTTINESLAESLAPPKVKGGVLSASLDWSAVLRAAHAKFPDGELRRINLPRGNTQLISVRMRLPGDWLPNGRSVIYFDGADGRLVEARPYHALPLATRAFNLVYPLHASSVGGIAYKSVQTAVGLTLTMLGSLAVWAFWSYRARRQSSAVVSRAPV